MQLREQMLDAAFLSPIDYARESSEYSILSGIAVSSKQATETVVLHFRDGIRNISTLAVDPSSTSEIILATILLCEEFDVRPTLIPASGSLDVMLQKAEAALLVGNAALMEPAASKNKLDLIEMWNDMTELPYIHGVWCCRERDLTSDIVLKLRHAKDQGVAALAEIGHEESTGSKEQHPAASITRYLESFSYDFSESARDGLSEFLRYAYYHGVLPDVADLHFYGTERGPDESAISLN